MSFFRRTRNSGRPRRFELLETRSLLAGNVTVAVNAGELDIIGDNANNNIQVTQLVSGAWKISGTATLINGLTTPYTTTDPVTGNTSLVQGNATLDK